MDSVCPGVAAASTTVLLPVSTGRGAARGISRQAGQAQRGVGRRGGGGRVRAAPDNLLATVLAARGLFAAVVDRYSLHNQQANYEYKKK